MAARAEIGGALQERRWAITSEAGAAGLTALSVRVWPAPAAGLRTPGADDLRQRSSNPHQPTGTRS